MPGWLLETCAQIAIIAFGVGLGLLATVVYAFTWLGNGGALVSEPFDPVAQIISTVVWLCLLATIWLSSRKLLSLLD